MTKISFWTRKNVRKPVVVKFQRSDGSYARFSATKIVQKPVKVTFYSRRKRRY